MPIVLEKVTVPDGPVTGAMLNQVQTNVGKALLQASSDQDQASPGIVTLSSSSNLRSYQIQAQDRLVVCNVFITDLVVSLPAPKEKRQIQVINAFGGQRVKVQRQDGQPFQSGTDSVSSVTISPGKIWTFVADGQTWLGYALN